MAHANKAQEVLPFRVGIYAGGMVFSGTVAPSWWMYDVTLQEVEDQAELSVSGRRFAGDSRLRAIDEILEPYEAVLKPARKAEPDVVDEVTLAEVQIYPAVQQQGGRAGGVQLPVTRVPLTAVDCWWIIEGTTIKGSAPSSSWMLGVVMPFDF
jgi:hypothetical protein